MERGIIVFFIRRQVYVLVIDILLLILFTVLVIAWALLVVLVLIILTLHPISCLGLRVVPAVTIFRRLLIVLIFVIIHISEKLNYLYKTLYLIF